MGLRTLVRAADRMGKHPMPKTEIAMRKLWKQEGRCYECGSPDANGLYRCKKCNRRRSERKQAKVREEAAKVCSPKLEEAHQDVSFWLSTDVANQLRRELEKFQVVFKHGNVQGQRLSGVLRGYIAHGLRMRGLPSISEVDAFRKEDLSREQVYVTFTKAEQSELADKSTPYRYNVAALLTLIVEREARHRIPIPHEPKLEGLHGGVTLVKKFKIQRVPNFLYAKTAPILTGYTSLRDVINLPPVDGIGEFPEPERKKLIRVRLSEDEYKSFEVLRKQHFKWVPSRSDLFREMFYEIADQNWFDLRERYDQIQISNSKALDRAIESERRSKKDRRKAKRYRRQRDEQLAFTLELMDSHVVHRAALMELGKLSYDEEYVKLGEAIVKKWEAFEYDMKGLYGPLAARDIKEVTSMTKSQKLEWVETRSKMVDEVIRQAREMTRIILGSANGMNGTSKHVEVSASESESFGNEIPTPKN